MEVILREHVENLGRRGDVVKVAEGYARNYLLPRKLALAVNAGNRRQIEKEKRIADARDAEERVAAEALGARLAAAECVLMRKVGEKDVLYGSVTAADIAAALATQHQIEFDRRKIQLHEPIKQLGEFSVPARVHRDVTVELKIKVVAENAPAE
jgi:large subunit ribosomal protein L9